LLSASILGDGIHVSIQHHLFNEMSGWVVDRSSCFGTGLILQAGNQDLARMEHCELRWKKWYRWTLEGHRRLTSPVGSEGIDDLGGLLHAHHDDATIRPHCVAIDQSTRSIELRLGDAFARQPEKGAHHSRTYLDKL